MTVTLDETEIMVAVVAYLRANGLSVVDAKIYVSTSVDANDETSVTVVAEDVEVAK